jgi:hypothetical protein
MTKNNMGVEAKDLRIGNYIKLLGWDSQDGEIVYYPPFDEIIKVDLNVLGDIQDERSQNEYEPILLTEEWLLGFGFEKVDLQDDPPYEMFIADGFGIWDFNGKHWIVDFIDQSEIDFKLYYVHQIQNLYYILTGEELKLKTD